MTGGDWRSRAWARRLVLALGAASIVAGVLLFVFRPRFVVAQEGMVRSGTVGIQNDTERKLFYSLLCTCGCPRETLGTCTCGFAHERRSELRASLAEGRTLDTIIAAYVDRFGEVALAVPRSQGVWMIPLGLIALGTGAVLLTLKRWRKRSDAEPALASGGAAAPRDALDDRLDDELRRMDD
jgi:cytochrome c-type biogenesis protein CcmH